MASALAQAYFGGLEALPLVKSRGKDPSHETRGAEPLEASKIFTDEIHIILKLVTNLV